MEKGEFMSVSKWAYDPNKCEGQMCCGDCDHCSKAFKTVYDVILDRFEEEERKAYANQSTGLKEYKVWNKAIQIIEEYVE